MIIFRACFAAYFVLLFVSNVNAGEAEDRIAEFLEHQSEVQACMSVLISQTRLSEFVDQNRTQVLAGSQVLQQLIICKDTKEVRMDGMRIPLGESHGSKEAQLISGDECFYWTSILIKQKVERIEMKVGRPVMGTSMRRVDPFSLLGGTCFDVWGETLYSNIFHNKFNLVEEYELKDGQYRVFLAPNDLVGWEVTFAKEPRWAPVRFRFFARNNAPKPVGKIKVDTILGWTLISTTTTEWQRIDEEPGWLPSKINMQCDDQKVDEMEFLFTDWKLGNDVDRSILSKDKFTVENIPKQIDFDKVAEVFNKARVENQKR